LFLDALKAIVKAESPTHICHLGDLVDINIGAAGLDSIGQIFDEIETWQIPMWIIAGNHDRGFFRLLPESTRQFVSFSTAQSMLLEIPGPTPTKLFLGHELGQPWRIRNGHVIPFLEWLKAGFNDVFKKEDWLLTGHCHTTALSPESRVGCVGQFCPEAEVGGYGVLTLGEDVLLELKNGEQLLSTKV
jgi:hypothetical protein